MGSGSREKGGLTIQRDSQVALVVNDPPANAGHSRNVGWVPGLGRFPAVGNGNPLQYSCLENSMDRGAWRATVHGVTKSQTQLSDILKAISKYSLILGTGVGFHHELGVGGKQTLSNL